MKLLLCSEGFHTPNTVEKCAELVGKPKEQISIAVINEAYAAEADDNRWVLHNLSSAADSFGGEFELVNLLALPLEEVERRIVNKDVIFVVGGHTDYLMSVYTKSGFAKLLPKLLETKVYVGSSAGSMVAGQRLSLEAYKQMYSERDDYGIKEYMNLVDFSIMPHLDSPDFPMRKESLAIAVKEHKGTVYGLRDDSAIVVDGSDIYTIGSEPAKFLDGKLVS